MIKTLPCLVRSRTGIFGSLLQNESKADAKSLSLEEQEQLKKALPEIRTGHNSKQSPSSAVVESDFDADDILDTRLDTDSIRARGFLKYTYNYTPSTNVKEKVLSVAKRIVGDSKEVLSYKFEEGANGTKFELLNALGNELNHFPTNAKLLHLKTVEDVVEFYQTSVQNVTSYAKLARSEAKPKNVHVIENAVRFHPEDKDAPHGGVTAFPGTGGEVLSLRQKRLLRQFQPKKEWFDYEDQSFDYSRPDKNMPWDSEIAQQMDRHTDMRYNLKTKKFTRIHN